MVSRLQSPLQTQLIKIPEDERGHGGRFDRYDDRRRGGGGYRDGGYGGRYVL